MKSTREMSMDDTQRKAIKEAADALEFLGHSRLVSGLRAILAAATQASALPLPEGWQPIETAPENWEIVGAEWQSPGDNYPVELMVSTTIFQDGKWRYPSGISWTPTHWMPLPAAPLLVQPPECNPHPDAPHGFNRNASHNAGRYVCDCEGWEPGLVQPEGGE